MWSEAALNLTRSISRNTMHHKLSSIHVEYTATFFIKFDKRKKRVTWVLSRFNCNIASAVFPAVRDATPRQKKIGRDIHVFFRGYIRGFC